MRMQSEFVVIPEDVKTLLSFAANVSQKLRTSTAANYLLPICDVNIHIAWALAGSMNMALGFAHDKIMLAKRDITIQITIVVLVQA